MKICYFGIYKPDESRNRIYLTGLREIGVDILECRDQSRGFLKYLKLFWKHWQIRHDYDFMIVGYPGHVVTPFAKLLSRKPVILDALCSLYEGVVISREQYSHFSLRGKYIRLIDRLAMKFADMILVESEAQKKFLEEKLHAPLGKCQVVYTGADDGQFFPDPNIKKNPVFTVVFRGKFLPEAGVGHILNAAKILEKSGVNFLIIGNGWLEKNLKFKIKNLKLGNLKLISEYMEDEELRETMLGCHVSLGQFEDHKRLHRTIPHKCFESLALGLPYVTARMPGVSEILEDGKTGLLVHPADPADLAEKLLYLKNHPDTAKSIGENGRQLYLEKFTPKILAGEILRFAKTLLN